jgi:hypothetical protein
MLLKMFKKVSQNNREKGVPSQKVYFRRAGPGTWGLFGPKGNMLYGPLMADREFAFKASKAFASSWYNWVVIDEGDNK